MAFNVEKKQEAIREELRSHVNAVTKKQEELKHDIMNEIIEMRETCK
jgi:GH35 family endo-1,4-beta-xylanase